MKMEEFATAWIHASQDKRKAALQALESGGGEARRLPKVVRFHDAAKQLSITPRSLAYAMKRAGIEGVRLPGRSRAFGIRAEDLDRLIGGGL